MAEENKKLPDNLDQGVPMLPGAVNEQQGPEDALGFGPKRGDYSNRIPDPELYSVMQDEHGNHVTVHLNKNVADVGDEPGKKGGVGTVPLAIPGDDPSFSEVPVAPSPAAEEPAEEE